MTTIDALRVFALIIIFGVLWNTTKTYFVDRNSRVASAMDYVYA